MEIRKAAPETDKERKRRIRTENKRRKKLAKKVDSLAAFVLFLIAAAAALAEVGETGGKTRRTAGRYFGSGKVRNKGERDGKQTKKHYGL